MSINSDNALQEEIARRKAFVDAWEAKTTNIEKLPNSFKNNDYVLFPREYFSGSDIFISFGNVPIENIVSLEFQMIQNVQPIFGYASYTWDAVMTGNRYITGAFRINFKETFYIKSILDDLLGEDNKYTKNIELKDLGNLYDINQLTDKLRGLKQEELRELSNLYEERLWGSDEPIDKTYQTMMLNPYTTFDFINSDSVWGSEYNKLLRNGFDIIVSFGENLYEIKGHSQPANGTMKTINGVHITGYKTIYQPTGDPVFEEYNFIAKDMDNSVSAILPKKSTVPVYGGKPIRSELK